MRLTLRTMLAYLDDILEPVDAEQLGQKIEESKFASDLVHRIRNSTRRLRLGAPKLDGKGMGLDPNTVAEYLDNTLRPGQVPDFEKVCLESDVHLAEVASCHQILTLVLGEPADIEHAVRERVYRLDREPEPGATKIESASTEVAAAAAAASSSPAEPDETQIVQRPPDELPAGSGVQLRSLAITLVLTFLTVALGLRAMGPFNRDHLLWRSLFGADAGVVRQTAAGNSSTGPEATGPEAVGPEAGGTSAPATGETGSAPVQQAESTAAADAETGAAADASPQLNLSSDEAGASAPRQAGTAPGTNPVGETGEQAPRTIRSKPPIELADAPRLEVSGSPAGETALAVDAAAATLSGTQTLEITPGDGESNEVESNEVESNEVESNDGESNEGESNEGESNEGGLELSSGATAGAPVGRYFSEKQVLGRLDPDTGEWFALPADAALTAGDQLLVFPSFRPQILLSPGMKLTLTGETRIDLLAPTAEAGPQLDVRHGRIMMVPIADGGATIATRIGERTMRLRFIDLESTAAIEVRRYLPPGANPERATPLHVVLVYATSGQVAWQEQDSSVVLNAGQLLAFAGAEAPRIVSEATLPGWLDGSRPKAIELRAANGLCDYITVDRSLGLALIERTEFRKQEERALACRALTCLDIYDPLLKALNDVSQQSYWRAHFETLRASVSRGPEAATRLREMIQQLYGDRASEIYRLCWGYSPGQLAAGAAGELVEHLSSDTMCIRVLAIWNLERITGRAQMFLPQRTPEQERTKIARWRQSLLAGEIIYAEPPRRIPELPTGETAGD